MPPSALAGYCLACAWLSVALPLGLALWWAR